MAQVPEAQLVAVVCDVAGQSLSAQHPAPQVHMPAVQLRPFGQSAFTQHPPSGIQELLAVHTCLPAGHAQVPPSPGQLCPVTVQSALLQQTLAATHSPVFPHRCPPSHGDERSPPPPAERSLCALSLATAQPTSAKVAITAVHDRRNVTTSA